MSSGTMNGNKNPNALCMKLVRNKSVSLPTSNAQFT